MGLMSLGIVYINTRKELLFHGTNSKMFFLASPTIET